MTIIHVTDTHIRGNSPSCRTDDFEEAIFTKLAYVFGVAGHLKVCEDRQTVIAHTGDLFHSPTVPYRCVTRLLDLLDAADVEMVLIPGQHDLVGHSLSSIDDTPIGVIGRHPKVSLIQEPELIEVCDIGFYGIPYTDGPIYFREGVINLVHAMIVAQPVPYSHILLSDELVPSYTEESTLVLCGDNHNGLPITQLVRRGVLNPGSLARLTIEDKDKQPSCYIIRDSGTTTRILGKSVVTYTVDRKLVPCRVGVFIDPSIVSLSKEKPVDFTFGSVVLNLQEQTGDRYPDVVQLADSLRETTEPAVVDEAVKRLKEAQASI